MTLFPIQFVPWETQALVAALAVLVLIGPVATIRRNLRKYLRIAGFAGMGFVVFGVLPQFIEQATSGWEQVAHLHWIVVAVIWMAIINVMRAARGKEGAGHDV
jgi:NADH:ubiquinone oxidoreductase subunit 4 (subunit M)